MEGGWLTDVFKREPGFFEKAAVELVEYTRVEYFGSFKDDKNVRNRHARVEIRDSVKPLEGIHKGKLLSAGRYNEQSLFLKVQGEVYTAPATIYYHNTENKIWIAGGQKLNTDDPDFTMGNGRGTRPGQNSWLPPGDYNLRIPEYPSAHGESYVGIAKNPTVWFPIATGGGNTMTDRFLHPGQVSYGCVSVGVRPPQGSGGWEQMYQYLIRSRQSALSVGTLRVYGSVTES